MQRYASIATAFAFGYFFTLGILTIGWAAFQQPRSFEIATGLAAIGAVFAALSRYQRERSADRG
ncbi:MAG: hypothetical protein QOE98_2759 [Gaiellaceae bacterium]|jgi:hypothetical protein|nr:hypothetical protein [Gaiellaceae bacterium]